MPKRAQIAKTPNILMLYTRGNLPRVKDPLQDQAFLALRFRSGPGIENSSAEEKSV